MTRLLMFDIDGTLTATDRVDTECFVRAMSEHLGVAIDSDWSRYRHATDSGIAAELFGTHRRPLSELPAVRERFIQLVEQSLRTEPGCCEQVPGASSFLARVSRTPGWVVGLATGGWSGSARAKLRHAGIDIAGLPFASADDAEARVDIMNTCLDRAARVAGPVSQVVYVGDGAWDAQAAAELDWHFIGIGDRIRSIRQRTAANYPVFADFADADAVLRSAGAGDTTV